MIQPPSSSTAPIGVRSTSGVGSVQPTPSTPSVATADTAVRAELDLEALRERASTRAVDGGVSIVQAVDSTAEQVGKRLEGMRSLATTAATGGTTDFDLLEATRRLPEAPPVVLMTSFGSAETEHRALEAGAAAYLDKPFQPQALIELLEKAIGSRL